MSQDSIILIIKAIIVIMVVVFLVKKAIKVAFAIVAILIIFQVGFMMTGTDLNQKFGIEGFFKGTSGTAITSFFNDFSNRREKLGVVDEKKVYNTIVDGLDKGVDFTVDALSKIDYNTFAEKLAENIYKVGKENISAEELQASLQKQFENLKPEDIEALSKLVQQGLVDIKAGTVTSNTITNSQN